MATPTPGLTRPKILRYIQAMASITFRTVAALTLLLHAGTGLAQAQLSPHEPAANRSSAETAPHCVSQRREACTLAPELDDYISAHFEALHERNADVANALPAKAPGRAPHS